MHAARPEWQYLFSRGVVSALRDSAVNDSNAVFFPPLYLLNFIFIRRQFFMYFSLYSCVWYLISVIHAMHFTDVFFLNVFSKKALL